MILTVHDELLFEAPETDRADETAALVRDRDGAAPPTLDGAADGRRRDRRELEGREELAAGLAQGDGCLGI